MRVLIDARSIGPRLTGVGRHTLNLLLGLSHIESPLEFFVLYSDSRARKVIDRAGGPMRKRLQWVASMEESIGTTGKLFRWPELALHARMHRTRLVHDVSTIGQWTGNSPSVITVHELGGLHSKDSEGYIKQIRARLKRARLIIPVSKTIANALEEKVNVPAARLRTIPNGISPWYYEKASPEETRAMRERYKLPGEYFLCVTVGTRPTKNSGFVTGFAEKTEMNEQWVFTLPKPEKEVKARYLDNVDDIWLRPLYAQAKAVIVPSTYEGFSLPPFEALASGSVPVVSDIAAHREFLGDILPDSLFFDPNNEESLRRALEALRNGGEPLKLLILERFRVVRDRFSFIETAKQIHSVYLEVLGK